MKPYLKYGLLLLLSYWLLVKGIIPGWNKVYSDFANYYVSSCLIVERGNLEKLYDNAWFQEQIKEHGINTPGKFSPFPPLTAWLMVPITFADSLIAMRIWLLINCVLLLWSVWLVRELTDWHWSTSALIMLCLGNGLSNNLAFGQVYLLITAGLFFVLWMAKRNNHWVAGFVLGLLTCLKYLPVTFAISFFATRNYKIVLATAVSVLTLIILQFWFFGFSVMNQFFHSVLLPHLDGDLAGQGMYSFLFQSWDNLFRHLFVYSEEYNPQPFVDWPQGRTMGKVTIYLIVFAFLLIALRKIASLKLPEDSKKSLFMALPFLAAFVVLPASATYHFVLLVVPITLLMKCDLFSNTEKTGIAILFFLIAFIPYRLFFSLATQAGLIFAYPRLCLISILYFGCVYFILRKPSIAFQKN